MFRIHVININCIIYFTIILQFISVIICFCIYSYDYWFFKCLMHLTLNTLDLHIYRVIFTIWPFKFEMEFLMTWYKYFISYLYLSACLSPSFCVSLSHHPTYHVVLFPKVTSSGWRFTVKLLTNWSGKCFADLAAFKSCAHLSLDISFCVTARELIRLRGGKFTAIIYGEMRFLGHHLGPVSIYYFYYYYCGACVCVYSMCSTCEWGCPALTAVKKDSFALLGVCGRTNIFTVE